MYPCGDSPLTFSVPEREKFDLCHHPLLYYVRHTLAEHEFNTTQCVEMANPLCDVYIDRIYCRKILIRYCNILLRGFKRLQCNKSTIRNHSGVYILYIYVYHRHAFCQQIFIFIFDFCCVQNSVDIVEHDKSCTIFDAPPLM